MSNVRSTWRAMRPASRALAVGGLVVAAAAVVAVGGGGLVLAGGLAGPQATPALVAGASEEPEPTPQSFAPGETPPLLPPTPRSGASLAPEPAASATAAGADPLLGKDGRFTVLLLGSDYRPAHPGNRTDAIMVVSVDPVTGKSAAFSIPRDILNFPRPGGGAYPGKVNAVYQHLLATTKNGNAAMERAISKAFDIEVDGFVLIGFEGVRRMVDAVGGVSVTMEKSYYDPYYWVNSHTQGWGLPAGKSKLNGRTALILARSRKGDNDYRRVRRQQMLVMAALTKVRAKGPEVVPKLLRIAADTVRTDLPSKRVKDIFDIVSRAKLDSAKQAVFGPRKYTIELGGSAVELDIKACRAWIKKNFPPVRVGATWPPTAAPAPTAVPVAVPTPTPAP
jgi:LCP family protein required for cell wall assembly